MRRTDGRPSCTTTPLRMRPAPMIATWGGTTTRLAKRPPIMPKFDNVIVAPRSSSDGIDLAAAIGSQSVESRTQVACVALADIAHNWHDEAIFGVDRNTNVDTLHQTPLSRFRIVPGVK